MRFTSSKFIINHMGTFPHLLLTIKVLIYNFWMQAKKYKELISNILKFTGLLVEHSYARHIYSSMEVGPSLTTNICGMYMRTYIQMWAYLAILLLKYRLFSIRFDSSNQLCSGILFSNCSLTYFCFFIASDCIAISQWHGGCNMCFKCALHFQVLLCSIAIDASAIINCCFRIKVFFPCWQYYCCYFLVKDQTLFLVFLLNKEKHSTKGCIV